MFLPILLLIGLIAYIFWNNPGYSRLTARSHANDDAVELLKRRYINGEIDEETYRKIKRIINE